ACRLNILPRTRRRLLEREKTALGPGAIYVFDEQESGIKRWTDGRYWSPSRINGNFLVYREVHKKLPAVKKTGPLPKEEVKEYKQKGFKNLTFAIQILSSNKGLFLYKPGGLIKKTISIRVNNAFQHMICYETEEGERLPILGASVFAIIAHELRDLQLLPSLLAQQKFRKPEHVHPARIGQKRTWPNRGNDRKESTTSSSEESAQSSQSSSREPSPNPKAREKAKVPMAEDGETGFKKVKVENEDSEIRSMHNRYSVPLLSGVMENIYPEQQSVRGVDFATHRGPDPGELSPITPTSGSSDEAFQFFGRNEWSCPNSVPTPPLANAAEEVHYSCFPTIAEAGLDTTIPVDTEAPHILTSRELQEQTYGVFKPLDFDPGDVRFPPDNALSHPSASCAINSSMYALNEKMQLWDYEVQGGIKYWEIYMGGDVVTADQITETEGDAELMPLQQNLTSDQPDESDVIYALMGIPKPYSNTDASSCSNAISGAQNMTVNIANGFYTPMAEPSLMPHLHITPEQLVVAQPHLDMECWYPAFGSNGALPKVESLPTLISEEEEGGGGDADGTARVCWGKNEGRGGPLEHPEFAV
ncbi:Gti1/Pac2 family-domain-containing protein, partial [Jimgerdemannia flammicorona]